MRLLTTSNAKTVKGEALGYMTFIMHLMPAAGSGYNVCPASSEGCRAACLNTAGRGKFAAVQDARRRKTRWFFEDRPGFMAALVGDIETAVRQAQRRELVPVFRLNGTSDIRWELVPAVRNETQYPSIMEAFPELQFYDYTKLANRKNLPPNYHLTFSRSEANDADIHEALKNNLNVAAVFRELPKTWRGLPVVSGDESDLRFLDPQPAIVGLFHKGAAKLDTTGFVL